MSRKRVKKTKKTAGEENPIFKPPDSPHFQIGAQSVGAFATEGRCEAVFLVCEAYNERGTDSPTTVINFDAVGVQAST